MSAALFQLVSLDGLPWPLLITMLLVTPLLVRLPGVLRALGVLVRECSQARLRHAVAKQITTATLPPAELVKMLDMVMDPAVPVAEKPAEDTPEARPGAPALPPPREEPPPTQ